MLPAAYDATMAEPGTQDQFAEVLQSAHPLTASGGLVLALPLEPANDATLVAVP